MTARHRPSGMGVDSFRLAMENSTIGMAVVGLDGAFIEVNPALCEILGRDCACLCSSTWQQLTHPDDLAADSGLVAEIVAGTRDSYQLSKRYLRPDGTVVHGLLSVVGVRDETGRLDHFISQIVDMTEEVRLRDRLELLANNISDVVALGGNDGVVQWVLPSITEAMGWKPEELVGERLLDYVHPDDRRAVIEAQGTLLRGQPAEFEARMLHKSGEYTWMRMRARAVVDETGAVVGRVAGWWDVQARRQAEQELAESELRFRAAMEAELAHHMFLEAVRDDSGDVVDFCITEANARALAYFGKTLEELRARTLLAAYPGIVDSGMFARYKHVVDTGVPINEDEDLIASAVHGGEQYYELQVARMGNGLSVAWRDVSDRVAARQALADSERHYRLLAENAADIVFQCSRDAVVEWVSPSVAHVLGVQVPEVIGRNIAEFLHPDDLAHLLAAGDGTCDGTTASFRVRVRMRGAWRWLEATVRPVGESADGPAGWVGSLRDVHDQVCAEEGLAEAEHQFRLMAENASDAILRIAPDRKVEWAAGSVRDLLGRDAESLVGLNVLTLFLPDDIEETRLQAERILAGEPVTTRVRAVQPDGSMHWVTSRTRAFFTADGDVDCIITAMSDAQGLVEKEQALQASEASA